MASPTGENVSDIAPVAGAAILRSPLKAAALKANRRPATKSKRNQLLALIAKPAGTKISVLTERLGWQAHTVRAALSRLRKQGHSILATKAPKTGEAVYRLVPPTQGNVDDPQVAASEV
ncbi:DUF3489 domain-containing protein [Aliirhizobium terrae]|uniref:DUF3489 domain-containing protein n=1 Tax=Terrirhizobium terrae TaxID=2926709 RepID=UPI002576453E|nr:DUF3489 domain-containing protein [Rhizobium sp. CC-CFT758]WJH39071.1 DUF3489 domain-containing protein [Rhizobium sp. CC-CFT758]